jgi:hypothetical protein
MARAPITLQDVLLRAPKCYWGAEHLQSWVKKVLHTVAGCGSGVFGYTVLTCADCQNEDWVPRGCHNRHCPTCLGGAGRSWVEAQEALLLPTAYFHVVMTLPSLLRPLALHNRRTLYGLLMTASQQTLLQLFRERERAACTPSVLAVMHTWNQRLDFHPHVHLVVSGGGLNEETGAWVPCPNPNFLVQGRIARDALRDRFLEGLQALRDRGALQYDADNLEDLRSEDGWRRLVGELRAQNWNVHIKKPFGGPRQVVRYLSRYTHRTALSNRRFLALTDRAVTFSYVDRRSGEKRARTLDIPSFLDLYSLHVLPKGFRRIRWAGLIAPGYPEKLAQARAAAQAAGAVAEDEEDPTLSESVPEPEPCPCCGSTQRFVTAHILPDGDRLRRVDVAPKPLHPGSSSGLSPPSAAP